MRWMNTDEWLVLNGIYGWDDDGAEEALSMYLMMRLERERTSF